jgi:hypothetical protein
VVEDDGPGDDEIGRALGGVAVDWPIDSRMTLPPPNTTSSPPTQWSRSTSIQRSVSARRMRSPVVGP